MTPNPASISSLAALLTTPCDCPPNYAERGRHAPDCRYGFIHEFLDDQDIAALLDRERSRETPPDLEGLRALSDAATPGEWNDMMTGSEGGSIIARNAAPQRRIARVTDGPFEVAKANAALIVAAVNFVRAALRVPDIGLRPGGWGLPPEAETGLLREAVERSRLHLREAADSLYAVAEDLDRALARACVAFGCGHIASRHLPDGGSHPCLDCISCKGFEAPTDG